MNPKSHDRLAQFIRSTSFLQLVRSELVRIFSRPFNVLALVALMSVPLLYAGVYLWTNKDPQGHLDTVPAALVVNDDGAMIDGTFTNLGNEVAQELLNDGKLGWQLVNEDTARAGVERGDYYFAVSFPDNFSENLTSAVTETPTTAAFDVITNDANNYLGTDIAKKVADELIGKISSRIGEEAAQKLLFGLTSAHDGFTRGADAVSQLADKLGKATDGASQLAEGANKLHNEGTSRLRSETAELPNQATRLHDGATQLADGTASAQNGADQLATGASELNDGLGELNSKVSALPDGAQKLADGAQQVADGNVKIADVADRIRDDLASLDGSKDAVAADLREALLARGLDPATVDAVLDEAQTALDNGLGARIDEAKTKVNDSLNSIDQLADGAQQVADGANALAGSANQLVDAVGQAAAGANRLADGADQLAGGITRLNDGAHQLADGTGQLTEAAPKLTDGIREIDENTALLASKLDEFAGKLPAAVDGAEAIRDKLAEGAEKFPNAGESLRADQAATLGSPVVMSKDAFTTAAGYGEGVAPFFLSLSAWLGVFTIFMIVNPFSKRAVTAMRNPLPVAIAGWMVPALIGFIEMSVLMLVLSGPVGLHMERPWLVWLVLVTSSVTFAALFQALRTWLDSTGQFIGLLLLVLQVSGAGGTFPIESAPPFIVAIHDYLPMSWTITALRQAIYGGDMGVMWHQVGMLLTLLGVALLVTWLGIMKKSDNRSLRDLREPVIH
ncbi:YhgE/Pip domain-containing protein [Gulosibacter bifidus]|uniref:YhgE/Pip family protein n=1 Tax=Gulosibacter bifidus TaxID=272239 RepID=A0ABW5RJN0_9MICO|nr:YhgE/Pip domain-containing protein [Gulosibacter bifidus]